MKYYWELVADKLRKAGWSLGWIAAVTLEGRIIWVADAHRGDGKRLVVQADEKLTSFMELESVIASTNTRKSPRRPTKDEKAGRILFVGL